ncbi:MAG TPA: branched chain amino acid aminotransferase, partial [Bacteroidales bacterium]|nr:branched chain amino acid aminotransferase [Bacteroidales bacterium]
MIDWSNLPFGYMPTHANIRCVYTNGTWGDVTVHTEETITLHMAATCLHYGQKCFEGLKAY